MNFYIDNKSNKYIWTTNHPIFIINILEFDSVV